MGAAEYQATLEELGLSNVAKGALERRFQEFLGKMRAEILAQLDDYASDKNGKVKLKMQFDLEFLIAEQDGQVDVDVIAGATFKPPTLVKKGESVFIKGEKCLVWGNEPEQQPLPGTSKVRAIDSGRTAV